MPDEPLSFPEQIQPISEHQRAADELARKVLNRATSGGKAISSEVQRETLALLRRLAQGDPNQLLTDFLHGFREILRRYEPALARLTSDAQIASFLTGGQNVLHSLPAQDPDSLESILARLRYGISIDPSDWTKPVTMEGEVAPVVRFPIIEAAAADLAKQNLLSSPDLYELRQQARIDGYMTGRTSALDAYERVRDALVDAVVKGETEQTFREKIGDALSHSRLSPQRQSMLFRNVVMRSYSRGQKAIVESPFVRSVAVFAWRVEINDSRLTDLCRCFSNSGLMGANGKRTSVYHVGDMVWRLVAPQSHQGCRCNTIFLTIKRAAEKGVLVAQKWHSSGIQPRNDELFVPMPDLSSVPIAERVAFDSWESPWAA